MGDGEGGCLLIDRDVVRRRLPLQARMQSLRNYVMNQRQASIFRQYFADHRFVDRYGTDGSGAVDVIIPIIHANELWRTNLHSLYREIPISRLLIGDGGCKDDSLDIAREFPRVEVFDHKAFVSLGFSLRKLIEEVRSEWFIYVHSDVYIPPGWFDTMRAHQGTYDWFGCPQQMTVMVEYRLVDHTRPYAGSQMGRKAVFEKHLSRIDDDFVYRQEDYVLADIVKKGGGKEGRIEDTFHYHQLTYRPSQWARQVKRVALEVEQTPQEQVRAAMTQAKGIVKYLDPDPVLAGMVRLNVQELVRLEAETWEGFLRWTGETNPAWLPLLRWDGLKHRIRGSFLGALLRVFRR